MTLKYDDIRGAKELFIFGHSSGHGDQVRVGIVPRGTNKGSYYVSVFNDGFPDRYAAGGKCGLIPDSVLRDGTLGALLRFADRSIWRDGDYARLLDSREKVDYAGLK